MTFNFFGLFDKTDKEVNDAFKSGYEAGCEQGYIDGLKANFKRSESLPQEEYEKIIEFLVKNNVELCCYDAHNRGLEIRRRIYDYDEWIKLYPHNGNI